jgi:hypothetical protein
VLLPIDELYFDRGQLGLIVSRDTTDDSLLQSAKSFGETEHIEDG